MNSPDDRPTGLSDGDLASLRAVDLDPNRLLADAIEKERHKLSSDQRKRGIAVPPLEERGWSRRKALSWGLHFVAGAASFSGGVTTGAIGNVLATRYVDRSKPDITDERGLLGMIKRGINDQHHLTEHRDRFEQRNLLVERDLTERLMAYATGKIPDGDPHEFWGPHLDQAAGELRTYFEICESRELSRLGDVDGALLRLRSIADHNLSSLTQIINLSIVAAPSIEHLRRDKAYFDGIISKIDALIGEHVADLDEERLLSRIDAFGPLAMVTYNQVCTLHAILNERNYTAALDRAGRRIAEVSNRVAGPIGKEAWNALILQAVLQNKIVNPAQGLRYTQAVCGYDGTFDDYPQIRAEIKRARSNRDVTLMYAEFQNVENLIALGEVEQAARRHKGLDLYRHAYLRIPTYHKAYGSHALALLGRNDEVIKTEFNPSHSHHLYLTARHEAFSLMRDSRTGR